MVYTTLYIPGYTSRYHAQRTRHDVQAVQSGVAALRGRVAEVTVRKEGLTVVTVLPPVSLLVFPPPVSLLVLVPLVSPKEWDLAIQSFFFSGIMRRVLSLIFGKRKVDKCARMCASLGLYPRVSDPLTSTRFTVREMKTPLNPDQE